MDRETEVLLAQAAEVIRRLRRQNELLGARWDTVELMASFVQARIPEGHSIGMEEDIAWRIDKHLSELKSKQEKSSQ